MRKKTDKEKAISKIILEYLEQIEYSNSILRGDLLNKEEKNFLIENPNAFVIGLISDQSVKAELAWSLPYRLSLRLKTFDFKEILRDDLVILYNNLGNPYNTINKIRAENMRNGIF